MNKKEILSYIKTFFMTIAIVTVVVVGIVLITKENAEKVPTTEELKEYKETQTDFLIEQYKYQEKLHDKNYVINVRLGLIYEDIGKLKDAEEQYKKAIKKAPYGNFEPTFLLAELYVQENRINEALELIYKVKEYPNPSLISSKAIFYSKVAEKLYGKQKYAESIRQYLNAYYYQEKNSYKKTNVLDEIPKVYLALANQYMKQKNPSKAIRTLEEGVRLTKSTELMYQLGVINIASNPEESLDLFEHVQIANPTVINYNTYKSLLINLINKAQQNSDPILVKSYTQKLKIVNRFAENNIIQPDDFKLEVVNAKYHKYPFKIREYVEMDFTVRNNTSYDVSKLYAQIKVYNNNKLVQQTEKRIATTANVIKRGRSSKTIHLKVSFPEGNSFIITKDVTAIVSIKRNERLKRTFLGDIIIPKTEE